MASVASDDAELARSSNGYTSACRNGLIAAMYALPNRPFGFTSTAICA